jgi:hypothetical protein
LIAHSGGLEAMPYSSSPDESHLLTLLIVLMAAGGPAGLVLELVLIPQYIYGSLGAIREDEHLPLSAPVDISPNRRTEAPTSPPPPGPSPDTMRTPNKLSFLRHRQIYRSDGSLRAMPNPHYPPPAKWGFFRPALTPRHLRARSVGSSEIESLVAVHQPLASIEFSTRCLRAAAPICETRSSCPSARYPGGQLRFSRSC